MDSLDQRKGRASISRGDLSMKLVADNMRRREASDTGPFASRRRALRSSRAYMMVEALVYIGVLFLLLGVGYVALYRCIDASTALRRNAADIGKALQTGE